MKFSTKKLFLIMARKCVNDTELIKVADIPYATFAQIKRGRVNPKPKTLGKLAKALKVDVTELLDD